MTTKARLHQLVDELSELEADDALRVLKAHRAGEWWTQAPEKIVLTADEAERFVDALDHPERFHEGLRKLASRAAPRSSTRTSISRRSRTRHCDYRCH